MLLRRSKIQLCPPYQSSAIPTPELHSNLDAAPLVHKQAQPLVQCNQATKLSVRKNLSLAGVSAQDHFLDEEGMDLKCRAPTDRPNTQRFLSLIFPDRAV